LPAFPGTGALKATLDSGVMFFGATAHFVDQSTDGGPILAQAVASIRPSSTLMDLERISFAQKLYILLVTCEWAIELKINSNMDISRRGGASFGRRYANPTLRNSKLEEEFTRYVSKEGIFWP
jgi:folate-dependent phosphoribosylglycinamide formyltransferase PurN